MDKLTQHNGKIFIVGDVLELCDDDSSRLLKVKFVGEARHLANQFLGDAIVFSQPNRVQCRERSVLIQSVVSFITKSNKLLFHPPVEGLNDEGFKRTCSEASNTCGARIGRIIGAAAGANGQQDSTTCASRCFQLSRPR